MTGVFVLLLLDCLSRSIDFDIFGVGHAASSGPCGATGVETLADGLLARYVAAAILTAAPHDRRSGLPY